MGKTKTNSEPTRFSERLAGRPKITAELKKKAAVKKAAKPKKAKSAENGSTKAEEKQAEAK